MNRDQFLARHSRRPVQGFSSLETPARYAPDLRLEPIHLEVHAHLLISEAAASCRVITTVESRSPNSQSLCLDALGLSIDEVQDPDGNRLQWSYDGTCIRVCWDEAIPLGEERRVEVSYRVIEPLTGLNFHRPDESVPDRPLLAVTDHETQRARYWLPCIDHPTVRTSLDLHIRSLESHEILATGEEVSSKSHGDGTRTVHWKLERRCPAYLLCLAVGELVRQEGGDHLGHPIAFFAPPPYTQEDLARSFGATAEMMDWMTSRLGAPLPYPKYFQFAAPGIGGAMENISLVSWDDCWVADARFQEEMGWLIDLINVHEMAHTWFGDAVVIRDYAHAWLKESWATYIEVVWQEETQSAEDAHVHLVQKARSYCTESDERYSRPIVTRHFDSGWDMFDHHLYPGGAWRLHMLRHQLGDDVFWPAVSDYIEQFTDRVVETADFRRVLEKHSGRSLARFFDDWIYSPGYPKLKATYSHDAAKSRARLVLEQTQEDIDKGIGLFHFGIEVAVQDSDGTWSTHPVEVDGQRQVLSWTASSRARQIVIDPDMKLLFQLDFNPGLDMLETSLREAPTVAGRIHAAAALGTQGSARGIAAIEAAWTTESHWGMRGELAHILGRANTYAAAGALARRLLVEEDPRVMHSLCSAAGHYRDSRIASALEEWLTRSELPYRASSEALISLGKQRKEAHLPTLERFADDSGWWGWVRRGALMGLGQSRVPQALPLLRRISSEAKELVQVRLAAIEALAIYSSWQDRARRDEICELLADLCRDPLYNIRRAAGRALLSAGDARHAATLEALCGQLSIQDIPSIERGLARLGTRNDISKTRALEDTVSRLNEKLRALQNRIESLESDPDDSSKDPT